ncbi:MAG: DUF4382 domain-containing protein [Candidatus Zixiibacteriota bacterium]
MLRLIIATLLSIVIVAGCGDSSIDQNKAGRLVIEAFDAPLPGDVDSINLTIMEVTVHHTENGWLTVAEPDTTYNFLQLVNGTTVVLADVSLAPGRYNQMRLILADSNTIVIDGVSYPLKVPSGTQSGVKLHGDFDIVENQIYELYIDFDASHSITYANDKYILKPSFKAFKKSLSAMLSGTVKDIIGLPIENATVEAITDSDTSATVTGANGSYALILLEGIYDISASADGYSISDTTYTDVHVDPDSADVMTGFDFRLQ